MATPLALNQLADVTKEVWAPAISTRPGLPPGETFVILLTKDEQDEDHRRTIFSVPNDDPPGAVDVSRMHMAARAPTLYRLLEQIVQLGVVPRDLEEVIRINLHRAAPSVSPMPAPHTPDRKSAWQKLLSDDL
jgi:hypothetical protein